APHSRSVRRCARASRAPPGSERPAAPRELHGGADLPELRKELELESFREVGHPARASGAGLVADDALHRLQVMAAPQLEVVIEVDQPLGELVQVPVLFRVVVDTEPRARDLLARAIRLAEIACQMILRNAIATPAQEPQRLVIERGRLQRALERRVRLRIALVHLEHLRMLVAEKELEHAVLERLEAG